MAEASQSYPFPPIRSVHRSLFEGTGLDEQTIGMALHHSDLASKQALSVALTEILLQRRARQKKDESHLASRGLALSDRAIATFAVNMLLRCTAGIPPPPELVRLFAVLHNLEVPANDQEHVGWKSTAAVSFFGFHPDASLREVARRIDVAPNTLRAWTRKPDFQESVRMVRYLAERGLAEPLWLRDETLNRPPRKR